MSCDAIDPHVSCARLCFQGLSARAEGSGEGNLPEAVLVQAPEELAPAPVSTEGAAAADIGRSPWEIFWGRFRKDRAALIGIGIIGFLLLVALVAPLVVKFGNHHPPNKTYYGAEFHAINQEFGTPFGPNGRFWFGVTRGAEDVLSRIMYGLRVSLLVAFVSTGIAFAIGIVLGLLAGFYGGKVDTLISRFIDILLSFPLLLIALGISASCGGGKGCLGGVIRPGLGLVIFIIALASFPYIARLVRGQVLSIREKEFVDASRMLGAPDRRIIFKEILPNLVAPVIVYATLIIPSNILFEAALSFLGVGIQAPNPSLGQMIADSVSVFQTQWWNFVFPGVFLVSIVLAFNLLGDGLRDALQPGRST